MVFPIVGGTQSTGYEISNSLRLEDGDSPHLQLAHGSDGTTKTFTYSWWFKQGNITINRNFFGHSSVDDQILIKNDDKMQFSVNNSADARFVTTQLFRDVSAWYHCVIAVDTTQSTNTNRVKIYINGTQVTAFDTANYPDQNYDFTGFNTNTNNQYIGRERGGNYFDGYMSEIYFIDGSAKAPTDFGKTDDNGVWIPIKYSGSYGTNGYKLEFKQTGTSQNSSGIGADTSGNDNHFAVTNLAATDVTTDTPTNNFATFNSVDCASNITLTEGNTVATANTNHSAVRATMGFRNGKWYWEQKVVNVSGQPAVGILGAEAPLGNQINAVPSRLYRASDGDSGAKYSDGSAANYGDEYVQNDIIGVAVDMDNGAIYFSKNGTFQDSGDPTSGSNKTNAAFTDLLTATSEHWLPAVKLYAEGMSINFGNPSHSISSGNADANGYGNFEYAVPSGYYSLCTKNLAEYG